MYYQNVVLLFLLGIIVSCLCQLHHLEHSISCIWQKVSEPPPHESVEIVWVANHCGAKFCDSVINNPTRCGSIQGGLLSGIETGAFHVL
jgi:hypothetical protein